jgi:alpha-glucosidase
MRFISESVNSMIKRKMPVKMRNNCLRERREKKTIKNNTLNLSQHKFLKHNNPENRKRLKEAANEIILFPSKNNYNLISPPEVMDIKCWANGSYFRYNVNCDDSLVTYKNGSETSLEPNLRDLGIEILENHEGIIILIPLPLSAHILGLGERAVGMDKKRKRLISKNIDPGGYRRNNDPLYVSIPFYFQITDGDSMGVFINYPGEIIFDFGVEVYNKTKITIKSSSVEFFIFTGSSPAEILRAYSMLTGNTFMPPKWAIGHTISRYTYYPSEVALEVVKKYKEFLPVESIYLDIHYMENYKLFTWDNERFGDGSNFIKKAHDMGVKVITIVDPSIKAEQDYDVFRRGLGSYVEDANKDIYIDKMWPGKSVFPDFINKRGQNFWKEEVKLWLQQGVDGIWLDMNEPTILTDDHMFDPESIHRLDSGKAIEHKNVRNAYPYFQSMATYQAIEDTGKAPFILSRSGYSGIQKYAAIWTGDNMSTWDDVKLQISIVTNLAISGVAVVGCDLGGFFGSSTPDLIATYYRMALFFPIYRNHKSMDGNDQEVFLLPDSAKSDIEASVYMRYDFLDQIYNVIYQSHKNGTSTVSPISFHNCNDNESFFIDDEYYLGDNIIYAPQIYENTRERLVYLPKGKWYDFENNIMIEGNRYFRTDNKYPIYVKDNSCFICKNQVIIVGSGKFNVFFNEKEFEIRSESGKATIYPEGLNVKLLKDERKEDHE